jgi:hypothetical protein
LEALKQLTDAALLRFRPGAQKELHFRDNGNGRAFTLADDAIDETDSANVTPSQVDQDVRIKDDLFSGQHDAMTV